MPFWINVYYHELETTKRNYKPNNSKSSPQLDIGSLHPYETTKRNYKKSCSLKIAPYSSKAETTKRNYKIIPLDEDPKHAIIINPF